ncbi:MAG: hypothetical protein M0031_00420 [Thermaerobacter sp.]|jgi:hypothetical protein|nr:hypothetical protein [Thermaerobacter sp.]
MVLKLPKGMLDRLRRICRDLEAEATGGPVDAVVRPIRKLEAARAAEEDGAVFMLPARPWLA